MIPRPEGWPTQLDASLLPTPANALTYPERLAIPTGFGPPWAGVCVSGGGSRSLSAEMGELRALASLGLLSKIGWLSTVSGGTWAATLFNWAPPSIADATLLGPLELDPKSLRWDSGSAAVDVGVLDPQAIGSAATRVGIEEMLAKAIELYYEGVPVAELWPRAIGALVLAPFGLGDDPQRYFTWTPWWLDHAVLPYNRKLAATDFFVTRPERPYLVTNSTLFYPPSPPALARRPGGFSSPWEVGYEFETTPMSAGIPPGFPFAGPPSPGQPGSSDLGGGWIDPFAMGSTAPQAITPERRFKVPAPVNRFRLSDLAGLSSVAFVYDVLDLAHQSGIHFLDDMVPQVTCWPVLNAARLPRNAARSFLFGDGGNLENQGIMPLLRRGLRKLIAFVNTETQLSQQGPNREVVVDSDLPPLFGLEWNASQARYVPISPSSPFRFNQVFDRATFDDLRSQLWNRAQAGATALAVQRNVAVAANEHYGVAAGTTDVLWVYLHPVGWWWNRLDVGVRDWMDVEFWNYSTFPNYTTVGQLHLNDRQVNLLAHLASWNVAGTISIASYPANARVFSDFLAG
ncbi:MAG: hypothetical protein U0X73_14535 [Thermoanaerobaculia bacterium]